MHAPDQERHFYAASLIYGLTLTNSQALLAAAPGLQLLVMLADRKLVRELCLANALLFLAGMMANRMGYLHVLGDEGRVNILGAIYLLVGGGSVLSCLALILKTRRCFTEWKTVFASGAMFLLGTAAYLYVPIASMTNPPVNWGYPRTVEGFIHTFTRGQYERIQPTESLERLAKQIRMYGEVAVTEFGLPYLLIALIPFVFLRRMPARERGWMLGLLAVYTCLAFILLLALNPASDRQS